MAKMIAFDAKAREELKKGVDALAGRDAGPGWRRAVPWVAIALLLVDVWRSIAAIEAVAAESLSRDFAIDWSGASYQEKKTEDTTAIALGLAVTRQAAIGAIRAAAFRIGQEQVQAARAGTAVHAARGHTQRDRRGGRHLDVLGRAHVRGQDIVVRAIDALRRDVVGLDLRPVAPVFRRTPGQTWLHHVVGIEIEPVAALLGRRRVLVLDTAHDALRVSLRPRNWSTPESRCWWWRWSGPALSNSRRAPGERAFR